jgi:hypothetical protein
MAKQTGLGDQLYVDGYDIAGDIQAIGSISTPIAALEMTGINKSAFERQYGLADGQLEFTSFFNDAEDASHVALSALPRTDGQIMYLRGLGAGRPAIGVVGKRVDYAGTRGDDGSLNFGVTAQGNGTVLDWCVQVSDGKETYAAAADGDSVDLGSGPVAYGFQAYLQVFSLGSGTATVAIEDSPDDSTWTELAAFTDVTGRTVERIESASDTESVNRYVRVSVSGTFTNLVAAVIINRNNGPRFVS